MTLDQINNTFLPANQTDKNRHGYLDVYEKYFSSLKDQQVNLLEIGLWTGASVRIWEKYFSKANVFAVDRDPACLEHKFERAKIDVVDQSKRNELINYSQDKSFDIIIDDGSHHPIDQIVSFEVLFEKLNDGGLYIVEDLNVSYNPVFDPHIGYSPRFFMQFIHHLNFNGKVPFANDYKKYKSAFVSYDGMFEFLHFYPHVCIIKKRCV